jgi:exopolyphosphatase/pppGpp-phosphohydrolase
VSKSVKAPIAAVDVGSNSIKMTVARVTAKGKLRLLSEASETVRLGSGLSESGRLADDRIEAALLTLQSFSGAARDLGATRLLGVATEAVRQATNGAALVERVRKETDWDLRILSGDEEADLTFRGLAAEVDLSGTVLVADIGGGSTEIIVAENGVVSFAQSLKLGSGTATDLAIIKNPPTKSELAAVRRLADEQLGGINFGTLESPRLIVIGGTGTYLGQLVADPAAIDSVVINAVLQRCLRETAQELAESASIPVVRARVLPAGVAIVQAIVDRTKPAKIEIAQSGLRTGLLLATRVSTDAKHKPAPKKSRKKKHTLRADDKFRPAMVDLIANSWTVLWDEMPTEATLDDPDAIHQVRVASRRLRAAMDVAADLFPKRWYGPLHKRAKTITGEFGRVRDADVQLEELRELREQATAYEKTAINYLMDQVSEERRIARSELTAFVHELGTDDLRKELGKRFGPPSVDKKQARSSKS